MDKKVSNLQFSSTEFETLQPYLSDYNTRIHVRELSRILKKPHRTISMSLKRLENKNIMKSKKVGKSKQYFLNFENVLTKDYIKQTEAFKRIQFLEKHFIIKKMISEVDLESHPVIIFGSYAKNTQNKESDLDILIVDKPGEYSYLKKKENQIKEFCKLYNVKLHLQSSGPETFEKGVKEKDHLILEIMKNHIILNNIDFFIDLFWRHQHG